MPSGTSNTCKSWLHDWIVVTCVFVLAGESTWSGNLLTTPGRRQREQPGATLPSLSCCTKKAKMRMTSHKKTCKCAHACQLVTVGNPGLYYSIIKWREWTDVIYSNVQNRLFYVCCNTWCPVTEFKSCLQMFHGQLANQKFESDIVEPFIAKRSGLFMTLQVVNTFKIIHFSCIKRFFQPLK